MKAYYFECKTPGCTGILPLKVAVATAFPGESKTARDTCSICKQIHSYDKSELKIGGENSTKTSFTREK
jgi:hypothetical protein